VADIGVVKAVDAERGVYGVLILGESSVFADRSVGSTGVLPDLNRFSDSCRVSLGAVVLCVGMTSGASCFGESGCLLITGGGDVMLLSVLLLIIGFISGTSSRTAIASPTWCLQLLPGALIDRSCRGGRPGIVAIRLC
jgi:hypothetical protein